MREKERERINEAERKKERGSIKQRERKRKIPLKERKKPPKVAPMSSSRILFFES